MMPFTLGKELKQKENEKFEESEVKEIYGCSFRKDIVWDYKHDTVKRMGERTERDIDNKYVMKHQGHTVALLQLNQLMERTSKFRDDPLDISVVELNDYRQREKRGFFKKRNLCKGGKVVRERLQDVEDCSRD
ncbi:unnamed protein product [Strongylus vulgaris]|uniref:Uncharacterized protein n=1 Tax=Strongylus vulgaris TaxID=40348 RepID=A0A3P7IQ20_STRVU|nr:unnamed protein product [Strongylus vulgaris]